MASPTPPQLPPPNLMIQELRTPNPSDTFFRELVDRNSPRWIENNPIKPGTLYSSMTGADPKIAAAFPELYFLSETVPIGSNTVAGMTQQNLVIWNWKTDPQGESPYNADISYLGDSVTNPVYARTYIARRDTYDSAPTIPVVSAFTGLIGIRIVDGGRDYTRAIATLIGPGSDSGAQISFVFNAQGEVIKGIVEVEGSDFDETSQIQIVGDGTEAAAQLILQPEGAVLTSQKKVELADDDPRQAEFVKVLRLYELLPGPWLPFTRYDDDLGPVQGRRRAVLNTGQSGGTITPTTKTNYEAREGSCVVSWQIEEYWTNGSGSDSNNPNFPLLRWNTYNDERGAVAQTSQVKISAGAGDVATITRPGGGKIIRTWFEPYADNPNLVKTRTETWIEVSIRDIKWSSERGGGLLAVTEDSAEPGAQIPDQGLLVPVSYLRTISPDQQIKHSEFLYGLSSWPILAGSHTDEKTGIILNYTKQWIEAGTPRPPRSGYRGPFVEDQVYDEKCTIRIITAADITSLPGPEAWVTTRQFSLPKTLLSVEAIWTDQNRYRAEAHAGSVHVYAQAGSRGGCLLTFRNGFRGNAKCIVARDYKYGSFTAAEVPTPFTILPASGSIVFIEANSTVEASAIDGDGTTSGTTGGYAFSTSSGMSMADFDQRVHEIDISDCLVGVVNIQNQSKTRTQSRATAISASGLIRDVNLVASPGPWNAYMEVRIPQSTPTPFQLAHQPDNQILVDVQLQEWGYGIWIMERYYIDLTGIV